MSKPKLMQYMDNVIVYNSNKFLYQSEKYQKSLQDLNDKTTKNNVVLLGDSLFGYGSNNFKNGGNLDSFTKTLGTSGISVLTGFTTLQDNAGSELEWGFSGRSYRGGVGATISHRNGSYAPYNDIEFYFAKYPGGGTFRYQVVGSTSSAWTTVDTNDTAINLGIVTINDINDTTTPTLKIEVLTGTVYVYAVNTFTKTSTGIVPYLINEGGTATNQWSCNSVLLKQFLQHVSPKQVHIWLGTNDSMVGETEDVYFDNLMSVVYPVRDAVSVSTDIIIYTTIPHSSDSAANTMQEKYRDIILQNMFTEGYSVFDLRTAWKNSTPSWYVDGVHPASPYDKYNYLLISGLTTTLDVYNFLSSPDITPTTKGFKITNGKAIANADESKGVTFKSDRVSVGDMDVNAPGAGVINIQAGGTYQSGNSKREMVTLRSMKMGLTTNTSTLADTGSYVEHVTQHSTLINGTATEIVNANGVNMGSLKDLILYSCPSGSLASMPKVAGGVCYLPSTDSANGGTIVFYDGTNWRSIHDKTIVTG